MSEDEKRKVVNVYWYKSVEDLPSDTIYIGRPSVYGNKYSSKSGLYTKEECVALHRVDLYKSLLAHSLTYLDPLKNHDLACWCKQPKKIVACHGDNYLHVLSDNLLSRTYDRSVTHYIMDDLRRIMTKLNTKIDKDSAQKDFLNLYIHFGDVRVDIEQVIRVCKQRQLFPDDLNFFLSTIVIDLELAYLDPDPLMIEYRFSHASWVIRRFTDDRKDRIWEPVLPNLPVTRISLKE